MLLFRELLILLQAGVLVKQVIAPISAQRGVEVQEAQVLEQGVKTTGGMAEATVLMVIMPIMVLEVQGKDILLVGSEKAPVLFMQVEVEAVATHIEEAVVQVVVAVAVSTIRQGQQLQVHQTLEVEQVVPP